MVGERGLYTKYNTVYKDQMTIGEFRALAQDDPKYAPPKFDETDYIASIVR